MKIDSTDPNLPNGEGVRKEYDIYKKMVKSKYVAKIY
jgi:hypothetical protein